VGDHFLRTLRRLAGPLAVTLATAGLFLALSPRNVTAAHALARQASPADEVALGRQLYLVRCSSCHGIDARGVSGIAPELIDAGAASADFYLRTGRMPLADYHDQPIRHRPAYPDNEIRALVAYVGSLDSGPGIPNLPQQADLSQGFQLYSINCAQCHNDAGAGGALGYGDIVPSLMHASMLDAAEAMRIGPKPMPVFGSDTLSDQQVANIAAYVEYLHHPRDRGGLGLGHLGPIPEGFVGWVVGMGLLLLVARLIGTRA
jgi:ubiquinol-cytochrome c reductase cytochrome c subunit